jgi:hypothetical protein
LTALRRSRQNGGHMPPFCGPGKAESYSWSPLAATRFRPRRLAS